MSLVGTLAKVAIGVAAAKGIGYVLTKRAADSGGTADGGLLGGSGAAMPSAAGAQPGLQDMLSSILGGKGQAGGGLGGLLEQLASGTGSGGGAPASAPGGGGLDSLIGGLAGAISGGGAANKAGAGGSFADVLNQSFKNAGEPEAPPPPHHEAAAGLMLRAMLQAAKCDGKLDEGEKKKLLEALGDASPDDLAFVNRELSTPVDVPGLAKQVPKGLEQQIYTVSVMAIDLDSQAEAQYLESLATALGLGPREVNAIHAKLGVPALFG
jgi:uncharacterized membrane protein YebE (DUF533 family)